MSEDLQTGNKVSVLIFTLNEEIHLPNCLASLDWCDDVIVIDSFSTDNSTDICAKHDVVVHQNEFEGFGKQRNWAIDNVPIKHDWVLILDADERVPPELAQELNEIASSEHGNVGAARMRRRFHMWGRWLKYSSLYPSWVVRFIHKDRVRYENRGHSENQIVQGKTIETRYDLIDENLKGVDEWFARQNRYARAEADFELAQEATSLALRDLVSSDPLIKRKALKRIACRLPFRPTLFFVYNYILRKGFLDGRDGLVFCLMKAAYERMIVIKKYDTRRLKRITTLE